MTDEQDPTEPGSHAAKLDLIRRVSLIVLALFPVLFAANCAVEAWRVRSPDMGFESFTGVKLPEGIMLVEHTTRFTDATVRRSHFWLLDGNRENFRALAEATRLNRADEAKGALSPAVFDGKLPEVIAAYEGRWEEDGKAKRLYVLYPGDRAVFQY